jgi:hypothetical protein
VSVLNSLVTGWEKGLSIEGAPVVANVNGDTMVFVNNIVPNNKDFNIDINQFGNSPQIFAVGVQNDGKVIYGGAFNLLINGVSANNIFRLNSDGSFDNTFNEGQQAPKDFWDFSNPYGNFTVVKAIKILKVGKLAGKILVGGGFTSYNGLPYNRIILLNEDGTFKSSQELVALGLKVQDEKPDDTKLQIGKEKYTKETLEIDKIKEMLCVIEKS